MVINHSTKLPTHQPNTFFMALKGVWNFAVAYVALSSCIYILYGAVTKDLWGLGDYNNLIIAIIIPVLCLIELKFGVISSSVAKIFTKK
ncbi:TPA: hypothetical protein ACX6PH_000811 [Photobacterium damselae]